MSLTRRNFLLGTAGATSGLILPSFYQRALEHLDRTGAPLLQPSNLAAVQLYAAKSPSVMGYELRTTPSMPAMPDLTLGEFVERYGVDLYRFDDDEEIPYDDPVDWSEELYYETWFAQDSPATHAFDLLRDVDLGPDLADGGVGLVKVWNGPSAASSYQGVEAVDEISLSLLQQRLDDLGLNFAINLV